MRIASLEVKTLPNNETVLSTALKLDLSTSTFQFFWSTFLKPEFTPAEKTIRLGPGCRPHPAFEWLDPSPWGLHTYSSNLSCAIFIQHRAGAESIAPNKCRSRISDCGMSIQSKIIQSKPWLVIRVSKLIAFSVF